MALPAPATHPMLDANGLVTSEWLSWLSGISDRTINGIPWDQNNALTIGTSSTAPPTANPNTVNLVVTTAGAAAETLTGMTIAPNVIASSLQRVGVLSAGSTGAGFTIALGLSTITGTLPDTNLSTNVPLKSATSNAFTGSMSLGGALAVTGTLTVPTIGGSGVSVTGNLTTGGTLIVSGATTLAALTAASVAVSAQVTVGGTLDVTGVATFNNHVFPAATDVSDLGRYDRIWRSAYVSVINAIVFKLNTQTVFGGYSTIGKQAGAFAAAVPSAATTIDFGQTMTPNDWVLVRAHDTSGQVKAEYLRVGTLVSGTTYNVTRDLNNSYAPDPDWAAGTPYLVLGTTGDGRIDMLAADGKPRIVFTTQGSTFVGQSDRAVIGNLNGYYGYGSDIFGAAFGDPNGTFLKIDPTNGLRLGYSATTKVQIDASGNASFTDSITAGTGNNVVTISAVDATYRLWIGHATASSAPFRVDKTGALIASSVTITASGVTIDSSGGITLGNTGTWAAYVGGNAVKFGRPSANHFGQTDDHYGVYTVNNGSAEWIYLANEIKGLANGSGGTDGNARIYLRAAGWDSTAGGGVGGQTTAVQIELRSGLEAGADSIGLTAAKVSASGLLDLSSATAGQIQFPSTQNPSTDVNTLDDYKETTSWTPVVVSSGGGAPTYTTQQGKAVKAGKMVVFWGRVSLATIGTLAAGTITITGLPHTCDGTVFGGVQINYFAALTTAVSMVHGFVQAGTAVIVPRIVSAAADNAGTSTADAQLTKADLSGTTDLIISGFYMANQ